MKIKLYPVSYDPSIASCHSKEDLMEIDPKLTMADVKKQFKLAGEAKEVTCVAAPVGRWYEIIED